MFDFDTTKRYDVFVRCSDGKDNDVEQLVVIVKKNAVPDFTNLPSKIPIKCSRRTNYSKSKIRLIQSRI